MRHRARIRGFNLQIVEQLLDGSDERYFDTATGRMIAVGKHGSRLIAVPFEQKGDRITPVTVHATNAPANQLSSENREVRPIMKTPRMSYFESEDVLHLVISDEAEAGSAELSPNVTAELNDRGELIGIEILQASTYMRDSLLDSAQVKLLGLANSARQG